MSHPFEESAPGTDPEKWFKSESWKNGLSLNADPSTDHNEFFRQYHLNKNWWDQAFAFLKDQDLGILKPGRYPIDGENVFASVNESPVFEFEKTAWESHRKYNDIQYVIKGKETIGITKLPAASFTGDYDEIKDIIFYNAEGALYSFQPGTFFIFFPSDLHRPGIKADDNEPVKKIVIKIKTGI